MIYTCYYCKGRVAPQRVRHIHPWNGQVYIFDDVPAEVCQQCGEVYFRPDTLSTFDRLVGEDIKPTTMVTVPVFSLAGTPAA